ncbi:diguanylate cyclase (GGDEF)-like protein [Actinoplanes lutulentus]|uniref:Diguanylate cyclase (GGDEF)-like protein n=1 Tax=Actinoplanes lutulentus TaxID=1287878 RepID=A0A327ZES2_9ACTN|nr:diguanylate cyclase [Actinoplanes lutulentus]MBB2942912.1 diguanylate cyclase (GGDEF)-like protein [Actinoplanes lutulentus]RAK38490.1 diguanylate cyclase (GGDEF)-like protein [Actinoplanes lutulentus]
MRFRTPPMAWTGYALAAVWFVVHLTNVGGWDFQIVAYKLFSPLLSVIPACLAWRGWSQARDAGLPAIRRHLLLSAGAWTFMTAASAIAFYELAVNGDASYPSPFPLMQACDLATLVLILAGLLTVPIRNRWSSSRLRLGLDMGTVLLAGALFLWYFVVHPVVSRPGADLTVAGAIFVKSAGLMVVLYAIARIVLGGVTEVSRRAMMFAIAATVVQFALNVMQQTLNGTGYAHFALATRQVFIMLLIAMGVAHLRRISWGPSLGSAVTRRPSSLMPYLAVVAADSLLIYVMTRGLDDRSWPVLAGTITLTALVVIRQIVGMRDNTRLVVRVDASMRALRESMGREQVLSDLGTALLRATSAADVHRLAADGAATLLAGVEGTRTSVVTVSPDDPAHWTVMEASGASPEELAGFQIPSDVVPAEVLARLAGGEMVVLPGLSGLGVPGFDDRPLMILPLLSGERFFGVLAVGSDDELPEDVLKSLQTLRTQVSLALDSVALTAELTRRAMHDMLTGLGNRALLWDRLNGALARAKRTGRSVGVLLLDLNGFKPVNDTYGHDAGDLVLKAVAERLRTCVRTEDTVARLGGDEFVILTEDLRDSGDALRVAERVVAALDEPVLVDGHELRTPASIGIALSVAGQGPDDVLRDADAAMYVAKRQGSGLFHVHA